MEKVTHPPLIDHLQEKADYYNQLFQAAEVRYGSIDPNALKRWIISVIEPIVVKVVAKDEEKLANVFSVLYQELLQMLGNKNAILYEEEYSKAWNLCKVIPKVFARSPKRILKAINSALFSIRTHQSEKTMLWLDLMEATAGYSETTDHFLNCGRVNAWLCGMSHLRSRALQAFDTLSEAQRSIIKGNAPVSFDHPEAKWTDRLNGAFAGEAGGFIGFGGTFTQPPLVALLDEEFVATDKQSSFVLYADRFGKLVLPVAIPVEEIAAKVNVEALKAHHSKLKQLPLFDDISSCVMNDSTFVFTRNSSYYLYIYAWSA